MQLETYNHQTQAHKKKNKAKRTNLFIFFVFLFVVGTILAQTLSSTETSFTGFSIFPSNSEVNSTIPIQASLSIPALTIKNEFPEIKISVEKESSIILDGKTFSLKETEREIIFKNFKGTISFNENKLQILKGKASEVILSGIPMTTDETITIEIKNEIPYKKIDITNDLYIKSLNYIASGDLFVNKDSLKTNFEEIFLNNYIGTLKAENKALLLNGKIESIEINGENRKIKISQ